MARLMLILQASGGVPQLERDMADVVFLVMTLGFFAVAIAYAAACQRL